MYDVAIIGAGIAGASVAAELASHVSVIMLEAEAQPGHHATGRSAAFWEECYGGPDIVPLTLASGPYLHEQGVLSRRGALYLAREDGAEEAESFMERFRDSGVTLERLAQGALQKRLPGLRPDWTIGLSQPACADIDVAALHHHYLARASQAGAALRTRATVTSLDRMGDRWRLTLGNGDEVTAGVVVNAAGAWADPVAALAGARPLGIAPLRRTVAQLRTDPAPPADLPLVLDLSGEFYFKPESGKLWLSPHDETPSPPCDAAAEELDVAVAIARFERVVDWRIEAVERKWAGLRSFAPDRRPVYGYDPEVAGFFWFAGQGGYGIQTAPAAARLAAQLMLGHRRDAMTERLDAALYSPARSTIGS